MNLQEIPWADISFFMLVVTFPLGMVVSYLSGHSDGYKEGFIDGFEDGYQDGFDEQVDRSSDWFGRLRY